MLQNLYKTVPLKWIETWILQLQSPELVSKPFFDFEILIFYTRHSSRKDAVSITWMKYIYCVMYLQAWCDTPIPITYELYRFGEPCRYPVLSSPVKEHIIVVFQCVMFVNISVCLSLFYWSLIQTICWYA